MKHDINKELSKFKKILDGRRDPFSVSDIDQVYRSATQPGGKIDTAVAIINALSVGYSVGYKAAKRSTK